MSLKSVQLPVIGNIGTRNSSTSYDLLNKNVYAEIQKVAWKETPIMACVKRPGMASATYTHTAGNGRGIYEWNSNLYYVIGTTLYKNGTSLGTLTGATDSGLVQFTEIQGGTPSLIIKYGDKLYSVNTSDTITVIGTVLSVTALSQAAGVNTATVSSTSNLVSGQSVIIAGATCTAPNYYNGTYTITVTTSTQFTYSATASGSSPAGGTITATPHLPTSLVNGIANLDGYLFVATNTLASSGGTVSQTNIANNANGWNITGTITPSQYPDANTGITRYLNYVVVMGTYSTEFFYNAGNAVGSVLSPVDGADISWGCPSGGTISIVDNKLVYVCQNKQGLKGVLRYKGLDYEKISTPSIERLISAETDFSSAESFYLSISGHSLYVLNLPNQNKTLVWDDTTEMWYEWTHYNGSTESYFKFRGSAVKAGEIYLLHTTDGKVYKMQDSTYQDFGNTIKVKIVTDNNNLQTLRLKNITKLGFIGDKVSTSNNLVVRYTDDDYTTWSPQRNIDISKQLPIISRLGQTQQRAYEFTYEGNTPFRMQGFEQSVDYKQYAKGIA